jgi:hypothetical protein
MAEAHKPVTMPVTAINLGVRIVILPGLKIIHTCCLAEEAAKASLLNALLLDSKGLDTQL